MPDQRALTSRCRAPKLRDRDRDGFRGRDPSELQPAIRVGCSERPGIEPEDFLEVVIAHVLVVPARIWITLDPRFPTRTGPRPLSTQDLLHQLGTGNVGESQTLRGESNPRQPGVRERASVGADAEVVTGT